MTVPTSTTDEPSAVTPPANPAPSPPAFESGARIFSVDDILAAAQCLGELDAFRAEWLQRQAAVEVAIAGGLAPDGAAVEAATNAFRYERDLVSGEEAERWLELRGLTFDDLVAWATRRLQAELAEADAPVVPTPADEALLRNDALLAPDFGRWAHQLARRVAAAAAAGPALPPAAALPAHWAALDAAYSAAAAAAVTPERRQRALASERLALTRVTFEVAEFDSADAGREAVLCAREDGATLRETAAANGFPCRQEECFLGDMARAWAEVLTSARLGEPVASPTVGDGCVVLAVRSRIEPSLSHDLVRQRVDAVLVDQHFRELETRHIRWRLNPDALS